ncbi:MAG: amino acid racemase [Oscillospiraceae bacterium]|nr:amino acid racemase [Oscillospiraceae bacterium]
MYKKLGILGGMGPLATCTLYGNIIKNTPARTDQEHLNIVVLNASYIPDRTAGILNRGESPLPYLLNALKELENCGCDLVAIPCNTSHFFYEQLQDSSKIKILNMIALTAEALAGAGIKKVYLMATEGTIKTEVYQKYLSMHDIETIIPSSEETSEMMRVIYKVKAGETPESGELEKAAQKHNLPVILGCTELSTLSFKNIEYIDAMRVLQDKILELFGVKR